MIGALGRCDPSAIGRLLDEGHASLRDDYEASVPAVEETVARIHDAGAVGARMVGGGFGGHVLGVFPPGAAPPERAFTVVAGDGARVATSHI
jgi:galactokinase